MLRVSVGDLIFWPLQTTLAVGGLHPGSREGSALCPAPHQQGLAEEPGGASWRETQVEQKWAQCCHKGMALQVQELMREITLGRVATKWVSHVETSFCAATALNLCWGTALYSDRAQNLLGHRGTRPDAPFEPWSLSSPSHAGCLTTGCSQRHLQAGSSFPESDGESRVQTQEKVQRGGMWSTVVFHSQFPGHGNNT